MQLQLCAFSPHPSTPPQLNLMKYLESKWGMTRFYFTDNLKIQLSKYIVDSAIYYTQCRVNTMWCVAGEAA